MASAYGALLERLNRVHGLEQAAKILQWDEETYMPKGAAEARGRSLGAVSAATHEAFTAPEVGRLLAAAEAEERDETRVALLRETRVAYDRATRVPSELVEATARARSRAIEAWLAARAKSDFASFMPHLGEIVDLRRRYAEAIDPSRDAYEVLFQDYEPWIPLAVARENLARLRDGVVPLVREAAKAADAGDALAGSWPQTAQRALSEEVLRAIGYDFRHGRLDVSAHPFTEGNVFDSRVTSRFPEDDLLSGLLATVHEAGHAMYEQGLPREHFGTPLCEARDLVVHESQSRLWENHVGRSRAFWEWALPVVRRHFPGALGGATAADAWRAANRVRPSFVRVEADEVTYHLHVALRFEIEEALVSGRLPVEEVPHAWNSRMQRFLGVTPPDDAHGCLQDIHWASGLIGYFPTYSLGSMLAAQMFETYEREEGLAHDRIARGEFAPLLAWLRERVHRHGKRFTTMDLIERATGAPLSPDAWLRYAENKFRAA